MTSKLVSRAEEKLEFALDKFNVSVDGKICADFGSSTGGFVSVLLKRGAKKVFSIDTSYGELNWNLRNDERVVVMERTNALFIKLPELVDLITIDVGWTKQSKIIPSAVLNLKSEGKIISLIKPHYEANKTELEKGQVKEKDLENVVNRVVEEVKNISGIKFLDIIESPVLGSRGKNREFLVFLSKC